MDTSRVPVAVPVPPDDVVIRLTYTEAQYLRTVLHLFCRLSVNFRGTVDLLFRVKSFANKLDHRLSREGVAHLDPNDEPLDVGPRD